jgi:hypothetical protein
MNLGEILDRTFQIYRSKFLLFVTLAALPALVIMGLQLANQFWWKITPGPYGTRIFLGMTVSNPFHTIALYHVALLIRLMVWPAFAYLTSRLYFEEQATLISAFSACFARWRSWLWLTAASWGIVLVLPEALLAGIFIGLAYLLLGILKLNSAIPVTWVTRALILTVALSWAAFLWLSSALSISFPAWTIERQTAGMSLRRSWTLSKGCRWKILFARFLPAFINWILSFMLSAILYLLVLWVMRSFGVWRYYYSNISTGIELFSEVVASTLIGPVFPIAITLFYYDQRIRKEGYDIERMMEAAGLNAPITTPAESKAVQA